MSSSGLLAQYISVCHILYTATSAEHAAQSLLILYNMKHIYKTCNEPWRMESSSLKRRTADAAFFFLIIPRIPFCQQWFSPEQTSPGSHICSYSTVTTWTNKQCLHNLLLKFWIYSSINAVLCNIYSILGGNGVLTSCRSKRGFSWVTNVDVSAGAVVNPIDP